MKALIVEDEIPLQQLYGRILENTGYNVIYAGDGHIAIQAIEQHGLPDLIILDIRLPNCNGYSVLEYLQSCANMEQVHVVITTASRSYQSYVDMLPSSEFLLKPVLLAHLQDVADRHRSLFYR